MQPDHSTTCVPSCPESYTMIPTPKAVFSHLNHQALALPFRAEPWTSSPDASFQPRVRGSCHCAAHPLRSGASPDRADQDRSHIESREIFLYKLLGNWNRPGETAPGYDQLAPWPLVRLYNIFTSTIDLLLLRTITIQDTDHIHVIASSIFTQCLRSQLCHSSLPRASAS
jgi:hypothetical protein